MNKKEKLKSGPELLSRMFM